MHALVQRESIHLGGAKATLSLKEKALQHEKWLTTPNEFSPIHVFLQMVTEGISPPTCIESRAKTKHAVKRYPLTVPFYGSRVD